MALKDQFRYFIFICSNWNIRLALFSMFHEIRGERKYGIRTTGQNDLKDLQVASKNKRFAYIYQPANYYLLKKAFDYLKLQSPAGSFVDYGSGMGRIMAVAAHYGLKKISGVEFAPELCQRAEMNLEIVRKKFPHIQTEIFRGDATRYPVKETDSIFTFFNPFDSRVMIPVVKNILASARKAPREIFVIYFNPTEKEIFLSAGFTEAWNYCKMEYLEFSILYKEKEDAGQDIESFPNEKKFRE